MEGRSERWPRLIAEYEANSAAARDHAAPCGADDAAFAKRERAALRRRLGIALRGGILGFLLTVAGVAGTFGWLFIERNGWRHLLIALAALVAGLALDLVTAHELKAHRRIRSADQP